MLRKVNPHIGVPLDEFVEENMNLIHFVMKKYNGSNREDLFQEASMQFVKCYKEFDGRGEFSSYAAKSMERVIWNYIRNRRDVVRLPTRYHQVINASLKYETEDLKELSKITGYKESYIKDALQSEGHMAWLDSPHKADSEGSESTLLDLIGHSDDISHIYLHHFLSRLDDIDRTIIEMKADGYYNYEIGEEMGIHHNTVRNRIRVVRRNAKHYFRGENPYEVS